jgi:hypothetical protein
MTKLTIRLGNRLTDKVTIQVSDITDAVEIYAAVLDSGRTHTEAAECLRLINQGAFKIGV